MILARGELQRAISLMVMPNEARIHESAPSVRERAGGEGSMITDARWARLSQRAQTRA
jgi:hypothetical protein